MIKHCMWRGQEINCSEYVQERHSFIGKCCYFNYARPIKDQVLWVENCYQKLNQKWKRRIFSLFFQWFQAEANTVASERTIASVSSRFRQWFGNCNKSNDRRLQSYRARLHWHKCFPNRFDCVFERTEWECFIPDTSTGWGAFHVGGRICCSRIR